MLTATSDAIVTALKTLIGIQLVGEWAGEIEDLLKTVQPLPSLHVVYAGAKFAGEPSALGSRSAPHQMVWTVVLLSKNLRNPGTNALEAYAHIEAVRAKLIKCPVADGWLWPVREGLILAKNGILGYGLDYLVESETES